MFNVFDPEIDALMIVHRYCRGLRIDHVLMTFPCYDDVYLLMHAFYPIDRCVDSFAVFDCVIVIGTVISYDFAIDSASETMILIATIAMVNVLLVVRLLINAIIFSMICCLMILFAPPAAVGLNFDLFGYCWSMYRMAVAALVPLDFYGWKKNKN